jgi:CubicO group peptidase (beta-lactamase class C family)
MLLAIVERVAGVPLRQYMRQEIFEPLGMKDTALGAEQDQFPRISEVMIPEGDFPYGPRETDWNYNSSHWRKFGSPWGGLLTTAQDMTVFCSMFVNGGEYGGTQLLSPTTVSRMTTNQLPRILGVTEAAKSWDRWGLGWRLCSLNGSMFGDLVSSETYGHGGSTGTLVWVDPQLELTCVILTNDPKGASRLRSLGSSAVAASVIDL